MGLNNPIPRSLAKESNKGAKVLASFIKPNQFFGADAVIPTEVLANAKGLAIITVLKAGFLFSGRAGSGIIVARLPDGSWSAPSAIMTAGAGVGGQIGAEITDFVFILNTRAAVESFSQAGSITLGGNISLAAGPLGRNAEAAGSASLKNVAAVFSYAKTKGLFAGVSLEGSVLVERRDANRNFYGPNASAKAILSGRVEPPPACDRLFMVLESRAFQGRRYGGDFVDDEFYDDIPDFYSDTSSETSRRYSRGGASRGRGGGRRDDYDDFEDDDDGDVYNSGSGGSRYRRGGGAGGGGGAPSWEDDVYDRPMRGSSRRVRDGAGDDVRHHFKSTYSDNPGRPSAPKPRYSGGSAADSRRQRYESDAPRRYDEERRMDLEREHTTRRQELEERGDKAVALYTFDGEQSGDLSFRKGDIITIIKKSDSTDDWWTGKIGSHQGIFPANYVQLV
uniref:ARAD1B07194p n=1 Tax=Blastobotrys adeninivorans TaxID=409370 RepID=A0A060T535_BLAAD